MTEKGRKKYLKLVVFVSIFFVIAAIVILSLSVNKTEEKQRKSYDLAQTYLEYSNNVSLESKNVFTYKNPDESGRKSLSINFRLESISAPIAGDVDFVIVTKKDKEISFTADFILNENSELFIKIENTESFSESVKYIDELEKILGQEIIDGIKKASGAWILVGEINSELLAGALLDDDSDEEEIATCMEKLLDKYDQTTTRYITSIIDDEVERYAFFTSNDKIEYLSADLKKCFPGSKNQYKIDKVVELIENFSGTTAKLDDNNFLTSLTVNNDFEEYSFDSETTFEYSTKYFEPEIPESYQKLEELL